MVHWKLKACPRCGGDVYIDRDLESWYEQCLQCSHCRELPDTFQLEEQPIGAGAEK